MKRNMCTKTNKIIVQLIICTTTKYNTVMYLCLSISVGSSTGSSTVVISSKDFMTRVFYQELLWLELPETDVPSCCLKNARICCHESSCAAA